MNRAAFFDAIRDDINLTTENVVGFEKHLDYGEEHNIRLDKMAYALATSSWETAMTLRPIREYGSETYLRSKRYYPHVGMGLIQVTWRENYIKAAKLLGLPANFFVDDPRRLLEWKYALPLLFKGMETGLYTGKKLDDYLDGIDESDAEDLREFVNARRIVNGTDQQVVIGKRALVFERGLKAMGWEHTADPEPKPVVGDPVVRAYQAQLVNLGYALGMVDGIRGPKTIAAVKAFQRDKGLNVDGIVGPETRAALKIAQPIPDDPGPVKPPPEVGPAPKGWFERWLDRKGGGEAERLN